MSNDHKSLPETPKAPEELSQNAQSPDGSDEENNLLDEVEGAPDSPLSSRRNPRVYIRRDVVERLVALGVPDDTAVIGRVVSSLADQAIKQSVAWFPSGSDVAVIDKAIADRLEELGALHAGLLRLFSEIQILAERENLTRALATTVQERDSNI